MWPTILVAGLMLALPAVAVGPAAAAEALVVLDAIACLETQAEFPMDYREFDGLPAGFRPVTNTMGFATVLALSRSCVIEGERSESVFAVVLVYPPAAWRWPGASHGIVLTTGAWTDSGPLLDALHAWEVDSATWRPTEMTSTIVAASVAESRTSSSPDFLLTAHASGSPRPSGHARLRVFDVVDGAVSGAFDSERTEVGSLGGVATASFVMSASVNDFPRHLAGAGSILQEPVDVVYRRVELAA